MFGFKKKQAVSVEKEWLDVMTQFFEVSGIDLTNNHEKNYWLTYGLGYFSGYLKSKKAKDKLVAQLEIEMLMNFGDFSKEKAKKLHQQIARSTSSYSPLYQELVFNGLEAFDQKDEPGTLVIKKVSINDLFVTVTDSPENIET